MLVSNIKIEFRFLVSLIANVEWNLNTEFHKIFIIAFKVEKLMRTSVMSYTQSANFVSFVFNKKINGMFPMLFLGFYIWYIEENEKTIITKAPTVATLVTWKKFVGNKQRGSGGWDQGCGDQSKVGKWLRRHGVPNHVRKYRVQYKNIVCNKIIADFCSH